MVQTRQNDIRTLSLPLLAAGLIIVVGLLGWRLIELKRNELKLEAIQGCAAVAAQSDPNGGFNGAVYQVCLEDKGYETHLR